MLRRTLLLTIAGFATLAPARVRAVPIAPDPIAPHPTRPPLLLASPYDRRIDPAPYLVSEKFDGVRALWDGRVLRHRSGREVAAPGWFVARLPAEPLDGELWLGRRRFDALSAVVRAQRPDDAAWQQVRYLIFELPAADGTFADRARAIEALARRAGASPLQAVEQGRVGDRAELQRRLVETVAGGGEGLVLHRADAAVATGRGDVLMKLKPYLDAEATVVGHHAGRGKYAGDTGALLVQTPEGRRFRIGSGLPDALRQQPPRLGSQVTYRYHDLTSSGLPRFASFLRVHDAM